jgi:histone deacetylase 1/2
VRRILQSNNLGFSKGSSKLSVCDACQQAKSHQLPFTHTHKLSTSPLELIYSDVWGPAIPSAGGFKYYVSFIDDFSKFVWFYPIKTKAEVFPIFTQFQSLVERQLAKNIISVQTDWGGKYRKLHSLF